MSPPLPVAPLEGLSQPVFVALSLALGVAFGFFLERAGFGSAKNLTSIFILRDFRVFRVMFSAVVTAMLGSQLLAALGYLDLRFVSFDPTYFWAMLGGGLLFGVGFYLGGYCPGTAVVALARGRWDSVAFLLGITLGIYGFALLHDAVGAAPWFATFFAPEEARLQTIHGSGPAWPWVLGLTAVALVAFRIVPLVERRFALRTVEQLEAARAGRPVPETRPPEVRGLLVRAGPVLAGAGALAVVALGLTRTLPDPTEPGPVPVATALDAEGAGRIDPLTLVGWVVADAHRRAAEEPPGALVLDVRPTGSEGSIPGAERVPLAGSKGAGLARLLSRARDVAARPDPTGPVVLVGRSGEDVASLVAELRRQGVAAVALEGGYSRWERDVLAPDSSLPLPSLRLARPADPPEEPAGGDAVPRTVAPDEAQEEPGAARETTPEEPAFAPAELRRELRAWLAGERAGLPPRLALPGSVPPVGEAVTVQAQGAGGGGCG